jgi:hypothetical protein
MSNAAKTTVSSETAADAFNSATDHKGVLGISVYVSGDNPVEVQCTPLHDSDEWVEIPSGVSITFEMERVGTQSYITQLQYRLPSGGSASEIVHTVTRLNPGIS